MNQDTEPFVKTTAICIDTVASGSGNAGANNQYMVSYSPSSVTVNEYNTLLVYWIVPKTGANFVFYNYAETQPDGFPPQLSKSGIVSNDGSIMAMFDADSNTTCIDLSITFTFVDKSISPPVYFCFDPQVGNDVRAKP
ncbi:hypothetical protein HF313_19445 [Massilia atriviolacea]|uniref:Uncharacterized protein n=1 Tax=Massilia atriviolacea TaxID=2495579 RepID=A0A430HSM4_9BURK|nr:hypothetical protein [Massilia atriviolacea]RSZ60520.1 hypothetical protein EJB06_05255 [Massilia atriviolacea]